MKVQKSKVNPRQIMSDTTNESCYATCKCGRRVGCSIVKDSVVIGRAYNGPSDGFRPDFCPRTALGLPSGEGLDLCKCEHAETAAVKKAEEAGHSVEGATVYVTSIPCEDCCRFLIEKKVATIYYRETYPKYEETLQKFEAASIVCRPYHNAVLQDKFPDYQINYLLDLVRDDRGISKLAKLFGVFPAEKFGFYLDLLIRRSEVFGDNYTILDSGLDNGQGKRFATVSAINPFSKEAMEVTVLELPTIIEGLRIDEDIHYAPAGEVEDR